MSAKTTDKIATGVLWALGMLTVGILAFIVLQIFARGLVKALTPSFFLGKPAGFTESGGGIFPMIWSTVYITGLTLIIIIPVALAASIYLSEYAREGRLTNSIRFSLDSLASLPSIVFGLFGLTLFVTLFGWSYCLMAGACTLAVLNLPTILRSSEESLRAVPHTYREASLGLGASRWTTIRQVVLPSAVPGILTGTMLTIGRIMGESAALVFTVGLVTRTLPVSPFDTGAPLASYIWYVQTEGLAPDYRQIVDGGAAMLLLLVLIVNFTARRIGRYYQSKKLLGER